MSNLLLFTLKKYRFLYLIKIIAYPGSLFLYKNILEFQSKKSKKKWLRFLKMDILKMSNFDFLNEKFYKKITCD
jgi:hypothetical protein